MDNEEEVIIFLKEQGFKKSPKKDWIWMREEMFKDGLHINYIDLNQMNAYAYLKGHAMASSARTNRDMRQIKLITDRGQKKLF